MQTLASFLTKLGACAIVSCGATLSQVSFNSARDIVQVEQKKEKTEPVAPVKKVSSVIIGYTSNGDGLSVNNSENINKLLSGEKKRLTIDEAGVKFGSTTVTKYDILSSPCNDETFYLLKHHGRGVY